MAFLLSVVAFVVLGSAIVVAAMFACRARAGYHDEDGFHLKEGQDRV